MAMAMSASLKMMMAAHKPMLVRLAVMVNLASASASEIYSAAIQDYERGMRDW